MKATTLMILILTFLLGYCCANNVVTIGQGGDFTTLSQEALNSVKNDSIIYLLEGNHTVTSAIILNTGPSVIITSNFSSVFVICKIGVGFSFQLSNFVILDSINFDGCSISFGRVVDVILKNVGSHSSPKQWSITQCGSVVVRDSYFSIGATHLFLFQTTYGQIINSFFSENSADASIKFSDITELNVTNSTITNGNGYGILGISGGIRILESVISNHRQSCVALVDTQIHSKNFAYFYHTSLSNCGNATTLSDGGGLSATYYDFEIDSCIISKNSAIMGGGVNFIHHLNGAVSSIRNSIIEGNQASNGGGIATASTIDIFNCSINNNVASILGGGMRVIPQDSIFLEVKVLNSTLQSNSAKRGGGIYAYGIALTMNNSLLLGNIADEEGGGLYASNMLFYNGSNVEFTMNSATTGGGVCILSPVEQFNSLTNSTFKGNFASTSGGAIYSTAHLSLSGAMVSGNFMIGSTSKGGGLYFSSLDAMLDVESTVFVNNTQTDRGGAIYLSLEGTHPITIQNVSVLRNSANNGAGICAIGHSSNNQSIVFESSRFEGNSGLGSVIEIIQLKATLRNSVVWLNEVAMGGSVFAFSFANVTFENVDLYSNDASLFSCSSSSVLINETEIPRNSGNCFPNSPDIVSEEGGRNMVGIVVGATIGCLILIGIILLVLFFVKRNRRPRGIDLLQMEEYSLSTSKPVYGAKQYDINYLELQNMEPIGRGAFGVVYRGEWRLTQVAVKQLLAHINSDKEMSDFRSEALILKNLRPHPNVVAFLGHTDDPISIVIEYCGGGSLHSLIHNPSKEIDETLQIKILRGIAAGMHHLHSEGIIHRDLAARNILLTDENIPKVSDFGLSRQKDAVGEGVTESNTGPLKWMAPEALKEKKYSIKSDVWSFGVVVWELTHRQDPYPDMNPTRAAMGVVFEDLRLDIDSNTPSTLADIMSQCFELEPAHRPTFKGINALLDGQNPRFVEEGYEMKSIASNNNNLISTYETPYKAFSVQN